MNENELLDFVREWMRFAKQDLQAVEQNVHPRIACFHAQQAAEKAIKAVLTFARLEFPKSHYLNALVDLLPGDWQLPQDPEPLEWLTRWALDLRYPGADAVASSDDAVRASRIAGEVVTWIESRFHELGIPVGEDA